MAIPERRARHPFAMHHRVRVEFTSAGNTFYVEGVTRNVSVSGVLFEAASPIPEACRVDLTMMAEEAWVIRPIEFVGKGRVVRVGVGSRGRGFLIAVKCVRPIESRPVEASHGSKG
jgi:hypothetical protein